MSSKFFQDEKLRLLIRNEENVVFGIGYDGSSKSPVELFKEDVGTIGHNWAKQ